jgi:NAD(P)-dependent dehydrogenase (short-subunit alcohol dehydrogenase family)
MRQRSHKTWFITGSSSGFGRALTETLLERGNRVAATLRKVNALDDLKEQYGERIWVAPLDVTDTTAVRAVVERAFDHMGRIDVVVNNAGYGLFGAAEEVSDDQIRRQIDTNLIGSIQVIRAALPLLRAQGGGRILQLSSAGGQTTFPNFSLYHTTKWAIEGFIEAVAQEVAHFNIEFTIVEPGVAKTNFGVSLVRAPLKRRRQRAETPTLLPQSSSCCSPAPGAGRLPTCNGKMSTSSKSACGFRTVRPARR